MQLEDMLSQISQFQKDKGHMFSLIHGIDPKDKHIHKHKHDHIHKLTCRTYLFVIEELLYGTWRRRERKRK
jgi:hypothetical protein